MSRYTIIKRGAELQEKEARKELYPNINVGHTKGQLLFMAFCYLPDGCKILFGDHDKINEYVEKHYDTCCHAIVKHYSNHISHRVKILKAASFSILGRDSGRYSLRQGTKSFLSVRLRSTWFNSKTPHLDMPNNNHRYWVLLDMGTISDRYNKKESRYPRVMGYWRKVPKIYLRQFKDGGQGQVTVPEIVPEKTYEPIRTPSFRGRDSSDIVDIDKLSDSAIRFLNNFGKEKSR